MLCPNCAVNVSDTANFCPNCGTNIIPMKSTASSPYATATPAQQAAQPQYATQEQYETDDKSAFERGYQQGYEWATGSESAKQTAQQAAEANTYQQYVPTAAPYVATASGTKSKIAAGLLAIFLGALGIHKFYLGYNKEGVIMLLVTLLTFGIGATVMEIIAIIEGIMYLVKTDSDFYYTYEVGHKPWF